MAEAVCRRAVRPRRRRYTRRPGRAAGPKRTTTAEIAGDDRPWRGELPPAVADRDTADRTAPRQDARAPERLAGDSGRRQGGRRQGDGWGGFPRGSPASRPRPGPGPAA